MGIMRIYFVKQLLLMTTKNIEEIAVEYGQTGNYKRMVYKATNQETRNLGRAMKE